MFVETGIPAARVVIFEITTLSPMLVLCPTLCIVLDNHNLVNCLFSEN